MHKILICFYIFDSNDVAQNEYINVHLSLHETFQFLSLHLLVCNTMIGNCEFTWLWDISTCMHALKMLIEFTIWDL